MLGAKVKRGFYWLRSAAPASGYTCGVNAPSTLPSTPPSTAAEAAPQASARASAAPLATLPAALCSAMVLAAGRGERMRPLTDTCPKPLLRVRGLPLMQWHLQALAHSGFGEVLVNTAWLGAQIEGYFGPQSSWNMREQLSKNERTELTSVQVNSRLRYSHEGQDFGGALETAGGIVRALPHLSEVFWVVAGDVFAPSFAFSPSAYQAFAVSGMLAHIWLVPNPVHNPQGDFGLGPQQANGLRLALNQAASPANGGSAPRHTFSTIALYRQAFFAAPHCSIPSGNPQGQKAALAPLLRAAMERGLVSAELYTGPWTDVGTPERLAQLNEDSI